MKKYFTFSKQDFYIFAGLIIAYWILRLLNLDLMPMFTDEAIYMRWSQIGSYDAAWRFIPLTDGKPPLYHWFVMLTIRMFSDPLIAGRIVSVVSGFFSLIFIWLLSYEITKKNKLLAHLTALLYVTSPFMLVYDRLAIVDGLLTTLSILSMYLAVLLVKYRRLDIALLLGGSVGAGLLTKASGLIFLLMSPLTILLTELKLKDKKYIKMVSQWLVLLVISAIISQLIYSILRLSQFYYRIGQKNLEFIIPLSEFLRSPFEFTIGNAKSLFAWQIGYLSIPTSLFIVFAFLSKKNWQQKLMLLGYYLAPFIMIASFNKIIFPRFLVFSTPFLFILASYGYDFLRKKLKNKYVSIGLLFILILQPAIASILWVTNPAQSIIPQADKNQYYLGQPSGHGVREIVDYLEAINPEKEVFVGTDGTFGLTPDAFDVYLRDNPNIRVKGYYPVGEVPEEVSQIANNTEAYFIYYNVQDIPQQSNIELVKEFEKTSSSDTTYLRMFKVLPSESNESVE